MELRGSLADFPLPDVVQLIGSARRTGQLLLAVGSSRASIFFDRGSIVHAEYRGLAGQAAVNLVFPEATGSFQFLAGVAPAERTLSSEWMGVIMEAARACDESGAGGGADLEGLDALDDAGGARAPSAEAPRSDWEGTRVKARLRAALRESFGRRAAKIERELERCPETKLGLLDFCARAERYIYVFLDSERSRTVADGLRAIVHEARG